MRHHTGHRARRIFTMLGLVILVTALVAIFCFRLDFLPRPTGPHHIGTTVFTVVDENRPEIFTSGDHPRTLTVQVWYPTTAIQGPTEPYVRDAKAFAGVLDAVRLPHATLGYLSLAQTHALTDAPIAEGSFPVVFVLTGNLGYRQSNTVQVEELVSRGFAVIGIDQPGTVSSALLEDGRRILMAAARWCVRWWTNPSTLSHLPQPSTASPIPTGSPTTSLRILASSWTG
ncbi:hypothetical protein QP028_10190 [Corynebacterium suedekumii]|nr:hypothetical protein QP028_10190 [Corynebacterium suedekumii]